MRVFRTGSEEETIAVGALLAPELAAGGVVLLVGNLGAGKTTLTKGIARGLGAAAEEEVSSPTFTLIHEYGEGRAYHIDLYRIEEARELAGLGLEEIFESGAVVLVEWGERFREHMPEDRWEIEIRHAGGDEREIMVSRLSRNVADECYK